MSGFSTDELKSLDSAGKLDFWKERYEGDRAEVPVSAFEKWDSLYRGSRDLAPVTTNDKKKDGGKREALHVRNIVAENIESAVNSSVPMPKVSPRREQDEKLARIIEDFIRNELNRLPFEKLNDFAERLVPVQGGCFWHIEWDNTQKSHYTVGEIEVSCEHPLRVTPQKGVYTDIPDMDYIILDLPVTKAYIKRKYDKDILEESEEKPELKGAGKSADDDMVTQHLAYYRTESGIGRFSWVNEVVLEDLENVQARQVEVCSSCGAPADKNTAIDEDGKKYCLECGSKSFTSKILEYEELYFPIVKTDGTIIPEYSEANYLFGADGISLPRSGSEADGLSEGAFDIGFGGSELAGGFDGGKFAGISGVDDVGSLPQSLAATAPSSEGAFARAGLGAGAFEGGFAEDAFAGGFEAESGAGRQRTKIPFYVPNEFPIVLQKNISVFGQLLGESDAAKIEDQQNTVNRLEMKIIDRLMKAGTRVTLPSNPQFRLDSDDQDIWRLSDPAEAAQIGVYQFSGAVGSEIQYMQMVYEEARQILGVTNSFQGRKDTTATSGVAKQFAAAQTAGRLESKRIMKDAAWAEIFRLIFKFALAYIDEPRNIRTTTESGETDYAVFNRYDFLEQDEAGQWFWNDQFLFSCDVTAPLANNREQMWLDTTNFFKGGAFGDPTKAETLALYWKKMELLHYPGASDTLAQIQEMAERQKAEMQAMQMQMMQQQAMQQGMPPAGAGLAPPMPAGLQAAEAETGAAGAEQIPPEVLEQILGGAAEY